MHSEILEENMKELSQGIKQLESSRVIKKKKPKAPAVPNNYHMQKVRISATAQKILSQAQIDHIKRQAVLAAQQYQQQLQTKPALK